MPAGTISLTNGSDKVTGSATSFNEELKANDFIVVIVGGVTYTLGVKSLESATALTLNMKFGGPSVSGAAWSAVANQALVGITAQVAADTARAIRGLNLDKANWQQVFSADGEITVTLPDGSQFTGPSWNSISADISGVSASVQGKMDNSANLSDLASKPNSRANLGLGNSATRDVGTASGSVAAGNDSRFSTVNGMSGGTLTSAITLPSLEISSDIPYIDFHYGSSTLDYTTRISPVTANELEITSAGSSAAAIRIAGGYRCRQGISGGYVSNLFNFSFSGNNMNAYIDDSNRGAISFASTSDKGLKKDIKYVEDSVKAMEEVMQWHPAYFKMKERGIIPESDDQLGFIANDLIKVSKECVSGKGLADDYDTETDPNGIDDAYYLNPIAISAKLTLALQAQQKMINQQNAVITELQSRLKALDGLDQ